MNKTLRLSLLAAAPLALPLTLHAQNELSNFSATGRGGVINTFATDYQVIGVNPANLGRQSDHKGAITIAEFGAGVASQSLSRTLFRKLIDNTGDNKDLLPPKPSAERTQLVNSLTGTDVINANIDITTLGASFSLGQYGSIAISNRYRTGVHLGLSHDAADIIVNGQDAAIVQKYYPSTASSPYTGLNPNPNAPLVSTALAGTNIQAAITSEYNIAYGVQVLDKEGFKLSLGLGYRYIQGLGIADVRIEDGSFYGYNAISPAFKIKYGNIVNNPNFSYENGSGLQSVGHGHGFDVGIATEIGKTMRFGVSVTEMGSMTWDGNVLTASDQKLKQTNSNGIQTYDLFKELSNQFSDDKSLFTYEANKERNAGLPTKFRAGAGIRVSELFEIGVDVTAPLNKVAGNISSTFFGLGVDYKPLNWLRLSSGFTSGAGYGKSLPLGVTFTTPSWEAGIGTRDLVGLFSDASPYTSVGFGLLRFKFGSESKN